MRRQAHDLLLNSRTLAWGPLNRVVIDLIPGRIGEIFFGTIRDRRELCLTHVLTQPVTALSRARVDGATRDHSTSIARCRHQAKRFDG